jgi:glycosyltransferase involved in cell wall biosynthesis
MLNVLTVQRALEHRPDVVLLGHILCGPASLIAGRLTRAPVVQYAHAKELAARPTLASAILSRTDATIAVSTHTAALATSLSADPKRLRIILPGCDPSELAGPPVRERTGPPTIVTVARLMDRYKGFDVMLRALPLVRKRVPDARWVIVGDGPLAEMLKGTAEAFGVRDACEFTGRLSDQQRDAWLNRAHVFAMPSRLDAQEHGGGEGLGIVYLEAGAHRVPAVAGCVGGSVEAVIEGETGLLVDATDQVAVADALCTLLVDRELGSRLGEAGAARSRELSWQRMANSVDDVLEQVVGEAG